MAFFGQRKPKQFNFKPVYLKEDEKIGFSEKMHKQWNRISYSELLKDGKKKTIRSLIVILAVAYLSIKIYEYLIQRLNLQAL
jgi:hypothetical protein